MDSSDITIEILRNIRDEIAALRVEIGSVRTELKAEIASVRTELKAEIAAVREELHATRTELKAEIGSVRTELKAETRGLRNDLTEQSIRHATQINELIGSTRDVYSLFSERFQLRDRVERCEAEIAALKAARD